MQKKEKMSNYDIQAEDARRLFLRHDQERIIKRYGLSADEMWLYLEYLHTPCRISRKSGSVEVRSRGEAWEECRDFDTVMTIYDLLCHAKGDTAPVLSGEWCTVGQFTIVTSPSAAKFTKKYEEAFQNHTKELELACKSLGGVLQEKMAGADITCLIRVTPYFQSFCNFGTGTMNFCRSCRFYGTVIPWNFCILRRPFIYREIFWSGLGEKCRQSRMAQFSETFIR